MKKTSNEQITIPDSFVAIDTETMYSSRLSVVSIAAVKYENGRATDEYYTLIEPPWDALQPGNSNEYIHHISESMVIGQPQWPAVLKDLENFCGDLRLVAHNAPFEKSVFKACNEYFGLQTSLQCTDFIDTMKVTKAAEKMLGLEIKGKGTHTLNTLCLMYGINIGEHHNALADSYMCGDMLVHLKNILALSPGDALALGSRMEISEPIIETHQLPGSYSVPQLLENKMI